MFSEPEISGSYADAQIEHRRHPTADHREPRVGLINARKATGASVDLTATSRGGTYQNDSVAQVSTT